MKMTEKNERLQHLFKYFELLIEAEGKSHKVNREITEVVQAIRKDLGLGSQNKGIEISRPDGYMLLDSNGITVKGGNISIEQPKFKGGYYSVDNSYFNKLTSNTYEKDARTLNVDIISKPQSNNTSFQLIAEDAEGNVYKTMNVATDKEYNFTFSIDLGKPSQIGKTVILKAKAHDHGKAALIRIEKQFTQK